MSEIRLDDATLRAAGSWLVTSARTFLHAPSPPELEFPSVARLSAEITAYLGHLALAGGTLADAAQTAGRGVSALMVDSSELDYSIAARLGTGYVVPAGDDRS